MKIPTKLNEGAKAPTKATDGSGAYDLYLNESCSVTIENGNWVSTLWLGISVAIPEGYVGLIAERSSSHKKGISLNNKVGVIDSDYRGEISLSVTINGNLSASQLPRRGDRVAQLLVVKVEDVEWIEVEKLDETERGAGGWGSTGK